MANKKQSITHLEKRKRLKQRKRLRQLERQLKEYSEEDFLKEAEKYEREMAENGIGYEPPEGFLEQAIAKGKLLEVEKKWHGRKER